MKNSTGLSGSIVAAVFLVLALAMIPTPMAFALDPNPNLFQPPPRAHFGSYAELSAQWWQWAFSLPADRNPFFDEIGCANGANGQHGPVWFLTGVMNVSGTAVRECTVPADKSLFFPIINTECSTIEPDPWHGDNEAELRACARREAEPFGNLFAVIDGKVVPHPDRYFIESPMFTFMLPPNNMLGLEAGSIAQSVSKGYYLLLPPLSPGEHTIRFGGAAPGVFSLDITYNLTVK